MLLSGVSFNLLYAGVVTGRLAGQPKSCSPAVSDGLPIATCSASTSLGSLVPYNACAIDAHVAPAGTVYERREPSDTYRFVYRLSTTPSNFTNPTVRLPRSSIASVGCFAVPVPASTVLT